MWIVLVKVLGADSSRHAFGLYQNLCDEMDSCDTQLAAVRIRSDERVEASFEPTSAKVRLFKLPTAS